MNLTIPIRAQSSTSSRLRLPRGNALVNNNKADRKRYIFSMITATLLIGTLIVSSVGGMMHSAFARDNFSGTNYTKQGRDARQAQQTTPTNPATPTTTKPVAPVPPTAPITPTVTPPVTPTVQPAATTTPAPAPASTESSSLAVQPAVTPQIVAEPTAPAPADTAPAIASMTAAQAEKVPSTVIYPSSRLSDETKNRLLILAAVAAVTGALLYTMSVIGSTVPAPRRQLIPVRYIVPVQEGSTR